MGTTTKTSLICTQRLFTFKKGTYIDFKTAFPGEIWHRDDFIKSRELERQIEIIQEIRLECITCGVCEANSIKYLRYLSLIEWLQLNKKIHLHKVPFQWHSQIGLEAELDSVYYNLAIFYLKLANIHSLTSSNSSNIEAMREKHSFYARAFGVAQARRGREFDCLRNWLAYATYKLYWEKAKGEGKTSPTTLAKLANACASHLNDCCDYFGHLSTLSSGKESKELKHCELLRDFWNAVVEFQAARWFYSQKPTPQITQALTLIQRAKTTFFKLFVSYPESCNQIDDENSIFQHLVEFKEASEHSESLWMRENSMVYFRQMQPMSEDWQKGFEAVTGWLNAQTFTLEGQAEFWQEFETLMPDLVERKQISQAKNAKKIASILPISSSIPFLTISSEIPDKKPQQKPSNKQIHFPSHIPRPGAWKPGS